LEKEEGSDAGKVHGNVRRGKREKEKPGKGEGGHMGRDRSGEPAR